MKKLVYGLLPLVLLIAVGEIVLRLGGLARSTLSSPRLPSEEAGIDRLDDELFWSLRPDLNRRFQGVTVATNALGLRSAPVGPKRPGEFRILSLGESTTFGAFVEGHETYSAVLERALDRRAGGDRFTVVNAGVSGYTSFQSLKYLELRGLALEPDLVLFYHEINDFLPTYLRDSQNHVVGMGLSDPQRYEDRSRRLHRRLLSLSAIYRWLTYRAALARIQRFQHDPAARSLAPIAVAVGDETQQLKLPRRVTAQERAAIFERLAGLCAQRGIRLVVLHPAYRHSQRHECLVTRFCRERGIPLFETYDLLHPSSSSPGGALFLDDMHPTVAGHERIGQALAAFLVERGLVPG